MDWLGDLFLFLHISGVIVAFGPTVAFPLLAARAQKEPMHGNFVLRATEFIASRVVEPGAVFVFLMGVGLIVTRGWNPLTQFWLAAAIVLLVVTFAYANRVQAPRIRRMIELTSRPPVVAGGDPAMATATMAGPGAAAMPDAAPAGPPPEFLELAAKAARAGMLTSVALFAIVALMVFKPNF